MQRELVKSSIVLEMGYEAGVLEVLFVQNALWRYYDVPPEVYQRLREAKSIGQIMAREIKPRYRAEKVTDA